MHWTTYDKATLWFAYEKGAAYKAMIWQFKRKIGAINNQLADSGIRAYAYAQRAWHKRHAPLSTVTALRCLMRHKGLPVIPPKKPFSIDIIHTIMERQAPWTFPKADLDSIDQRRNRNQQEGEISFQMLCTHMRLYGFRITPWHGSAANGKLYHVHKDGTFWKLMNKSEVVFRINQWLYEHHISPLHVTKKNIAFRHILQPSKKLEKA